MKTQEKVRAVELRRLNRSIRSIAAELSVSYGSVCNWVRGVLPPRKKYGEDVQARRRKNAEYAAQRYAERRKWIDEIKLSRGCTDCGYKEHPAALQFDHVDPSKKAFQISISFMRNWESILAEIAKCVVRCANCHAVKTATNKENRK